MTTIRNDKLPAKKPRLGTPKGVPVPPMRVTKGRAPDWYWLVQPGPAGNPSRTAERRRKLGQEVPRLTTMLHIEPAPSGPVRLGKYTPRRSPRMAHMVHTDAHAPKGQENRLTSCGSANVALRNEARTSVVERERRGRDALRALARLGRR